MSVQLSRRYAPFLAAVLLTLLGSACPARRSQLPLLAPAPDSPIALADGPGSVAVGQVNQDRKLDLVVASAGGITVLLGQGDGRFGRARQPDQVALCFTRWWPQRRRSTGPGAR